MNRTVSKAGAATVTVTVFLFALCMLLRFPFGSYFVCMFLPLGFILMTAGFRQESGADRRVAADAGLVFSAVYAVLILLVYDSQTTTVRLEALNEQAARLLDYRRGGLMFNYDLLGYGMMALSTFFTGLSMGAKDRADRWLKGLMMVHGVFFLSCVLLPMTGMFAGMAEGESGSGGTVALLCWCACFLPIGILSWRHFSEK